jgi:hypothetical protein
MSITERHPYSQTWREEYGRSLAREEIRLVQAYRGLETPAQDLLLRLGSRLVVARARRGAARGARVGR